MAGERRPSLKLTAQQTMTLAWRSVRKMQRTPEQFSDVLIQPVLFTLMFAYIFGGAVSGDVEAYLPLMIPEILAMTTLTARSEEHTSELQSRGHLVCRLLLEKKNQ